MVNRVLFSDSAKEWIYREEFSYRQFNIGDVDSTPVCHRIAYLKFGVDFYDTFIDFQIVFTNFE